MNFILIAIVICGTIYVGFKFINGKKNKSFVGIVFTAGASFISLASGDWQDTLVKIVAIINNRNAFWGHFPNAAGNLWKAYSRSKI